MTEIQPYYTRFL